MASQGPNSPGTGADDAGVGTVTWSNPGNITSSDNAKATATVNATVTHYLKGTNYGFSIPSGATIDGIVVEIEKSANQSTRGTDSRVRIIKGGTIGSTDKSSVVRWPATASEAYTTYGSSSDLWGETWTDSDINGSTFGATIAGSSTAGKSSVVLSVDHIRITVYYTAAASGVIKTKKGLAYASTKTYKGLATASTKTDKGVAAV